MKEEERDIYALRYNTPTLKADLVGTGGINKIRLAKGGEEIAGNGGYLTTYIVERYNEVWKIVPGWMVVVEYKS